MGAMRPNQHFSKKANIALKSIELTEYLGVTRFGVLTFSTILDVNIGINPKTSFQVKLPYTFVRGELANVNGFGDISISGTRNLYSTEKQQINFTVGFKLPTGSANKLSPEGKTLPMYYQTTLGTYDIVFGLSLISKSWLVAAGYQQSLNPAGNSFLWGSTVSSDFVTRQDYPVGNGIERGKDVMARVEKNFRFGRFNAYVGLLPIYRFTKDKIVNGAGQRVEVKGSDGLALTLLVGAGYRLTYTSGIKIMGGFRILERETNPDGLSREQVFTVGYEYRF